MYHTVSNLYSMIESDMYFRKKVEEGSAVLEGRLYEHHWS